MLSQKRQPIIDSIYIRVFMTLGGSSAQGKQTRLYATLQGKQ